MKKKKLVLIDANSLIHRAYHALPPLTTRDGVLVNAVYGFINIFLKMERELKPDYIGVCFDVAGGTFRDEIYEDYKAGRTELPQEFYDQFDVIKEFLETYNVEVVEKKGYEADDLIGTYAKKGDKEGLKTIIVSGDKDMLQLVGDATEVELTKKGVSETVTYTPERVEEEFGFGPELMIDYKALRGDPSDNIPGVAGVGEKTATTLLTEHGDLDTIYAALEKDAEGKVFKKAVAAKLEKDRDNAYMSRELATIADNVKLPATLKDLEHGEPDARAVFAFVQQLGFRSILSRLPKPHTGTLFEQDKNVRANGHSPLQKHKKDSLYTLIDTEKELEQFLNKLAKQKVFAIDTETTSLHPIEAELLGASFSWKKGEGYYITAEPLLASKKLKKILEDESVHKVGHNIKYDYQILKQAGLVLQGITFDTMIASYLINPGSRSHSLDGLAFAEFSHTMIPITDLIGPRGKNQKTLAEVPVEQVAQYAAEDADYTWQLYKKYEKSDALEEVHKVFSDIEVPLLTILGDMELAGIKIDSDYLKKFSTSLSGKIATREKKIFEIAGEEFNVASPRQLKEILFEKLGIPTLGLSRTKTGVSTAAGELEKLRDSHDIIQPIMDFRELAKLKNTYTDALPKLIQEKTGRVHTSFNQTVAATGRLSSSDPNLQNIPIRTELGAQVRNAFVAERGYKLLAADYSQFELRIIAHMSRDKHMIDGFNKGEDIHRRTAGFVYDIDPDKVTDQQRREAKEVNFGILYGLGPKGMAERAGIPLAQAKEFFAKYFEIHPDIKKYLEEVRSDARHDGYTETLFGRRRYFPEITSEHPMLRAAAERAAVNLPIQGTQADLIKMAMIEMDKVIKKNKWTDKLKMLLQVHDELVFEVHKDIVDEVSKVITKTLESIYTLDVPLIINIGVGKSWGECK